MEERLLEDDEMYHKISIGRIWDESKKLWRVAFPSFIATLSTFGTIAVAQVFLGHISELDLASFALTESLVLRFSGGILTGMASATETLCGQAFGARQYHMLGIYLQRSWIINLATATIFVPIFVFTSPIFKLLGEEDNLASESGKISLWLIPILFSYVFRYTIQQFLQAQLKTSIVAWIFSGSFLLDLLLSWVFYVKFEMGLDGVMAAFVVSSWMVVFGELVYVCCGGCSSTWKGFTIFAFFDLFPALKLSISSGVMLCIEVWYYSVLVLVAGYMTDAEVSISAFSISLAITSFALMVSFGFLASASVRVSNELGRGDVKAAKFSIKVVLYTSVIIGLFLSIISLMYSGKIASLYTSDDEIVEYVSSLSVLIAFTVLLNSIQPVLSGVAIGAGMQGMVAFVNISSYYIAGIPIGILLGFVAKLEAKGLWIGMMCGVTLQTVMLGYITWITNWDEQVKIASERLNKWLIKSSDEANGLSGQDEATESLEQDERKSEYPLVL